MRRKVLDTSVLLSHWRSRLGAVTSKTIADAEDWARELSTLRKSNAIVTPVYLEVVCGVTSVHELRLARAYLDQFRVIDGGAILAEDWLEARRLAERIPRNRRKRQLGDC